MGKSGFEPEFQTSSDLRPGPLDDFPNNQSKHPSGILRRREPV